MLAVTILSVGLVLVSRSYITSLRAIKTSQNFLLANLLLEEKIWQKQEQGTWPEGVILDEEQGNFIAPFDNFSYKIAFESQEDLSSLYKSTFKVFWQERKKERFNWCVTYIRAEGEQ